MCLRSVLVVAQGSVLPRMRSNCCPRLERSPTTAAEVTVRLLRLPFTALAAVRERCWLVGVASALGACLGATPAWAQSRLVGSDYISRPLVLPKGVVRIDAGPRRPYPSGQLMPAGQLQFFINKDFDDLAYLVPGAGVGVIDKLELGGVWPLRISPDLNLSDLSVYGKYSLQRGEIEVAGYAELRIPVENDLEIAGGVPVYIHLDGARLETGGFVRLTFGDEAIVSFEIPLSAPIQVSPEVFVGPEIGVSIVDFDDVAIPVGVVAGYTLGGGISSIGDLLARLTLVDVTNGADTIRFDIGAEIFFDAF
jgi:hypothetical protein